MLHLLGTEQAEDIKSALEEAEKNHSDSMREVEATAAVTNEEITW